MPVSPSLAPTLRCSDLRTTAELAALEREWEELWRRCPDATPFVSPGWLLPWWQHLGRGKLRILAFRQEDRLVGLAPLAIGSYFGLPLRRLGLLGTGNTDYPDVLIEPAVRPEVATAVGSYLQERRGDWDFCDFQQLREQSPVRSVAWPEPFRCREFVQEVTPYLPLPGSEETFLARLPPRLRANLRYYSRRLQREGETRFTLATSETLHADLSALFRLHGARWRTRGLPGVFSSRKVQRFHREACSRLLAAGHLRLFALHWRQGVVAVLYCLSGHGRYYYYAGGFAPEISRLSPGTVLTAHALQAAIREGCDEWDFLRGGEAYKYAWGAQERHNRRLLLWQPSFPSRLAPRLNRWERRIELRARDLVEKWVDRRRRGGKSPHGEERAQR